MIYEGRCKRFGQKLLLRLTGSIFVNSDKIQLWQYKVTPFPVKFWVWFGSLGTKKWSRNIGLALYFFNTVLKHILTNFQHHTSYSAFHILI